jgi:squalene-hopene/tetraprenyl-beta-curcumene cyclase
MKSFQEPTPQQESSRGGEWPGNNAKEAWSAGETAAATAIRRTCQWFFDHQAADGHWCGELEGDSILQSETILLLAWLNEQQTPLALRCAEQLLRTQLPSGGWAMAPGGRLEISGSVKAYFALKLTGHDPESEPLRRARAAILSQGGADAVNSFTRFYLALLGQISFEHCPAVPPEFVLLPDWAPLNKYRMSAWSRTIFVPLSIVWALRPAREIPPELGISELFLRPPEDWPELRSPGADQPPRRLSWETFFRGVDRGLKALERWGVRPLRARALQAAQQWMLERFEQSDGLGAIYPPIVWSLIALKSLGYSDESQEVTECRRQLKALELDSEDGQATRLQPCLSPVWDTAISLRALQAAGVERTHGVVRRAVDWLLDKECRRAGDWSRTVEVEPGGWFFEYRNAFYPDVDDTIMVVMALLRQLDAASPDRIVATQRLTADEVFEGVRRVERVQAACRRAVAWTLAMQNRDGGWAAFDKDNDLQLLCEVPFADHNAMIDPSTPDITARVLEMLGQFGFRQDHSAVQRAITLLRATQESDGSWYGRWGVNYIYGTWQVLVGLVAVGVPTDDPAVQRGAQWLVNHQGADGGWGETIESYDEAGCRGQGPSTASQTAWALLGLLAAGWVEHPAVARGVEYLVRTQSSDGAWPEPEFTGTGFPRVFYLRYHLYPIYFPLLALSTYESARRR